MPAQVRVWQRWTQQVEALLSGVSRPRAQVLAMFVLGMLWAEHVSLPRIARAVPGRVRAASRERQLRRWLANPAVSTVAIWRELRPVLLAAWTGRELVLVLDATPHGKAWTVLTLGVVAHRRVLPLGSVVVPQQTGWSEPMSALLRPLCSALTAAQPAGSPITLVADRGLSGPGLIDLCTDLGWHWVLRLNTGPALNHRLRAATMGETSLWPLVCRLKRRGAVPVTLFRSAGWRSGHLTVRRDPGWTVPWVLFSDRPGGGARVREYRQRHFIEATFQDMKRRGWQVEASHLRHADRIERLLLVLALLLWWVYQLGERAIRHGDRRRFEARPRRDLSLAALGRQVFAAALAANAHRLPLPFHHTAQGWAYAAYLS